MIPKEQNEAYQLLLKADIFHKAGNEAEFSKIADILAKDHTYYIDEVLPNEPHKDLNREFAMESLIKEIEFWDKFPFATLQYGFCYEDTEEYQAIWNKYFSRFYE